MKRNNLLGVRLSLKNIALILIMAIMTSMITITFSMASVANAIPQQNLKPVLTFEKIVKPEDVKNLVIEIHPSASAEGEDNVTSITLTYACPAAIDTSEGNQKSYWKWVPCKSVTLVPDNATFKTTPGLVESVTLVEVPAEKLPAGILYSITITHSTNGVASVSVELTDSKGNYITSVAFTNHVTKAVSNKYIDVINVFMSNIADVSDILPIVLPGKGSPSNTSAYVSLDLYLFNMLNWSKPLISVPLSSIKAISVNASLKSEDYFMLQEIVYIATDIKYYYTSMYEFYGIPSNQSDNGEYVVVSGGGFLNPLPIWKSGDLIPIFSSFGTGGSFGKDSLASEGYFKAILVSPEAAKVLYIKFVTIPSKELIALKELKELANNANTLGETANTKVGELSQKISTIYESLKEFKETQSSLKADVDNLGKSVAGIKNDLSDLSSKVGTLESELSSLRNKVGVISSSMENSLKSLENKVNVKINSMNGDLSQLEANVTSINAYVTKLKPEISEMKNKLATLQEQLSGNVAQMDQLTQKINELSNEYGSLSSKLGMTNVTLGIAIAGLVCGLAGIILALRRRA